MMFLASSVGDMFATGGMTALIGISVTFIVLVILIVLVLLITKIEKIEFKELFAKLFPKKAKETSDDAVNNLAVDADDKKLVAAITAAISLMLETESGEEAPKASFKVKSIKRI